MLRSFGTRSGSAIASISTISPWESHHGERPLRVTATPAGSVDERGVQPRLGREDRGRLPGHGRGATGQLRSLRTRA